MVLYPHEFSRVHDSHSQRLALSLSYTVFLYLLGQFEHGGTKDKMEDIELFIDRITHKEYIMKRDD